MADIDKTSGLFYQIKRPAPEVRKYSVSFSKLLGAVNIASLTSVVATKQGLVGETSPLVISNQSFLSQTVYFSASGGTDGENYEITITIVDLNGDTIVDDVLLKVRKAGIV